MTPRFKDEIMNELQSNRPLLNICKIPKINIDFGFESLPREVETPRSNIIVPIPRLGLPSVISIL